MENQNNGGNAHEILETDEDGIVNFRNVPQNKYLQVKVVTPPPGAIPTLRNVGDNDALDSELANGDISDSFRLTTSGAPFSELDLGYRMPNSMIVRVWDDENGMCVLVELLPCS